MIPPVLTVKEAAETMKCSPARIWQLIADGTLVRGKQYGRKAVVIAESVFNALEATYHPRVPAKATPPERPAAKRARPAPAFDLEAERARRATQKKQR